jgi:transcriptional regulator with XRE-family HTH domain
LTRSDVARALGVSITSIRSLERGVNHDRLKLQLLGRPADALGYDLRALVKPVVS